ncbi:hypothetical protein [Pseudomonas zhanjiangensis]|uniref:Uncharacterized protein n=1 Tax=Pseudomonas zhanjiangensis TaxID=3239015 RepID=A0ABV3YT93_9PSED
MELTREVLDCMKTLRRKIREEQALDIRMSQPDAITAMLSACLASSDEEIRRLGQRLAQFSERPFERGEERAAKVLQPAQPPAAPAGGSVRIYRGQRVYA